MRKTAIALCVVGALLLACGGVLAYVRAEIVSSGDFSDRLVSSLDHKSVRTAASHQIVDRLVNGHSPDLLAIKPLLTGAVNSIVASQSFRRTALLAVEAAHAALIRGDRSVPIRIAQGGEQAVDAVRSVSPAAAERLSPHVDPVVARLRSGDPQLSAARHVIDVSDLWWVALVCAALALAAAARLAGGRRGLAYVAAAVAAAGALMAVLVTARGARLPSRPSGAGGGGARLPSRLSGLGGGDERSAVRAVWFSLFGDLRVAGVLLAAGGLVAWILAFGRRWARQRAAHAAAAGAIVVVVAASTAAVALSLAAPSPPRTLASGCNGSPLLCDRRLNDVVFPATHNSFAAAAEPGWLFANQRYSIARQLDDGIRGFLLDIHFGVPDKANGRVRTDLRAEGMDRNKVAKLLSPEALRTADRLAGRIGAGELSGKPSLYLCHTLCELGAEPLDQELKVIGRFLGRHPNQVLMVIVEDYVPPRAIEYAFDRAGFLPYVATLERETPLPTLGDLIDSGKRLVVFAEG